MKLDINTGLVLEGGGMRGAFTSGVLDAFMKHGIEFPYIVSVSAGACNGLSYVSRQPGRARTSNIDLLVKYDYVGIKHLLRTGCIFDQQLLYYQFPQEIIPYDYDTYFKNPTLYEMVVTNCHTGLAEYLSDHDNAERLLEICRASSALPYVSKMVPIDGKLYLDGGICDSIPIERAISMGYRKNVVVLTRNKGYRKKNKDFKIPPVIYKKFPRLRVALSHRNAVYNRQLELLEQMEERGDIIVIRPERPLEVERICKDAAKLQRLYDEGVEMGERFIKNNCID